MVASLRALYKHFGGGRGIFVQNQANHALEWPLKGCSGVLKAAVEKRVPGKIILTHMQNKRCYRAGP